MLLNDQARTTSYQTPLPQTYQPVTEGSIPTRWKMTQDYTDSQEIPNTSTNLNISSVFKTIDPSQS